jgi:hypothetical protein
MSDETAVSGNHGDNRQPTTSLSDRALAIALFSGAAFALLVGSPYLAMIEIANGKQVHLVGDALFALFAFAPACATIAVLGTAIITKRWKTTLRCFLPLAASLFLAWALPQAFMHMVLTPDIEVAPPFVHQQDSKPQK